MLVGSLLADVVLALYVVLCVCENHSSAYGYLDATHLWLWLCLLLTLSLLRFCLASSTIKVHLIVAVGEAMYISLPRGESREGREGAEAAPCADYNTTLH